MLTHKDTFYWILLFQVLILPLSLSQTNCSGGMAGIYPCTNIDLQSVLPLSTFSGVEANDIWGWTDSNDKEYAIIGLDNGTAFVDITNPTAPIYIGKLPNPVGVAASSWRDIKVVGNYAYIGTEAVNHQIQVFNLTRLTTATGLPVTFTSDGSANIGNGKSHNIVANTDAGYICGVGATEASGGLVFYDLANPTSPNKVGSFSTAGYSHDAICVIYKGPDVSYIGQEICIGFNEDAFDIVDVTNKSSFNWISNTNYTGVRYTHQGWITDDHKYLFIDDELDEWYNMVTKRKTFVFDISDLDSPVFLGSFDGLTKAIDHNQYVKGNYLYQANYQEGVQIWDISDINNINQVASFDIYPTGNLNQFNGAWSVYPYFKSGNIVISGIEGGLFVVKPNLPHYVMEHTGSAVQTIEQGNAATFSFQLDDYDGYSSMVNLNLSGVPTGASVSMPNSVAPSGTVSITLNNTAAIAPGRYHMMLAGNGTPAQRIGMALIVNAAVLPVELTEFTARAAQNSVHLNWSTMSETNNRGFQIERYAEDEETSFKTIAWVDGRINSQSKHAYHFEDTDVEQGVNYFYRLRQIDLDDQYNFSEIVSAKVVREGIEISVFPNPVKDVLSIRFEQSTNNIKYSRLSMMNVNGQLIRTIEKVIDHPNQQELLDVSDLMAGMYMIQFLVDDKIYTRRFMKQ